MHWKVKAVFCFFVLTFIGSYTVYAQTHLRPVAIDDSSFVFQPFPDTVNVTLNDSSLSGDSFCIKQVYGSAHCSKLDCKHVVFQSDSSAIGHDTAWYVICNVGQPNLCDTAMLDVNVLPAYRPFLLTNSKWRNQAYYPGCDNGSGPDAYYTDYCWTTVDTIIGGLTYKTLYSKSDVVYVGCIYPQISAPPPMIGAPAIAAYLREDTGQRKVYSLSPDSATESVLYDFNASIGDTIYYRDTNTYSFISSFGCFQSGGQYYRTINIKNYHNYLGERCDYTSWIEGFGSTAGLFSLYLTFGGLSCFSSNGVPIYPAYYNDTCAIIPLGIESMTELNPGLYPNPASDICTLRLNGDGNLFSASVVDLTGRLVMPLFNNQRISTFEFNTRNLSEGLYLIRVTAKSPGESSEKLVWTGKLVKAIER